MSEDLDFLDFNLLLGPHILLLGRMWPHLHFQEDFLFGNVKL